MEISKGEKGDRLVMKDFHSLKHLESTEKQLDPMKLPATIANVRSIELWLRPSSRSNRKVKRAGMRANCQGRQSLAEVGH